ncbi:MAG: aldehyde dehydrogenase family protein [Planctomycetota bacterium]
MKHFPLYLANQAVCPNSDLIVKDKYSGEVAFCVPVADTKIIEKAIVAAADSASACAELAPYQRQSVLDHCVARFTERSVELAEILCIEAGKPIRDSRGEVSRLIDTFRIASEESVRIAGEIMNLEISPRAAGYQGMWKRVPIGPCSFIAPFNFPLNLAAHKIAPAIAAGCPFVLKPASRTPIGALLIGEILAETDLPAGSFSILPCRREAADAFTTDERFKLLSFTGSPEVGWALKSKAGRKRVTLELGGNAACIIDEDADVEDAVARLLVGAFYQSGQSCIGVQRILIHDSLYDDLARRLVEGTKALVAGNPSKEDTFIGPLIDESEVERLLGWIDQAVSGGAKVLCGGTRAGAVLDATLLENVDRSQPIYRREAFGPIAILGRFGRFEDALDEVNDSDFGLQAGVFTRDLYKMHMAWDRLEVGGVVIGDVPSWRVDNMPYGGVKQSGLGREGVRFAIQDMTEIRNLVIRTPKCQV